MDFTLTDEQSMLQDSVDKFVRDHCDVERHRQLKKTELGFDPVVWQQFAELGWLSVPFSEEDGGFGGGSVDIMVMAEALGKGIIREPFLSTVVTCGGFLQHGGSSEQKALYIPAIIEGSQQWAFAFAEKQSGFDMATVATSAVAADDGYSLNGQKIAVLNGVAADYLIVSARTQGGVSDKQGISLFIVKPDQPGIVRESFSAVDGSRGANITFNNVQLSSDQLLGTIDQADNLITKVVNESIVAMAAEALGAMQVLLDTTVEYTKTREQFGQPISKFQALQHRMADMYLKVEETRSLLFNAAIQLDESSQDVATACAALKAKMAEAGRYVSQESVQLHGGIGMTDELNVGHHYKRLMVLGMLYGDEDHYVQKYAELTA